MDLFELSHKRMIVTPGGFEVPAAVVGRQREWSIEAACRLIISREALFLYRGDVVTDLTMLPEVRCSEEV
jgi:hypothetical protein